MPGPIGTSTDSAEIDEGTLARTPGKPPGTLGLPSNTGLKNQGPSTGVRLLIELDLAELVEIQQPHTGQVRKKGAQDKEDVFVMGDVISTDVDRPKKVLSIVQKIFMPLSDVIQMQLDTPQKSDRLLKAKYGYPLINSEGEPQVSKKHGQLFSPYYIGAGAKSSARSRLEKFKPIKGDPDVGITAYVFEGAISLVVLEYFKGKANVENILATAIAHELGHNLGLDHSRSASDIMFVYARESEAEQKRWMVAAEHASLRFSANQIAAIRKLLQTP